MKKIRPIRVDGDLAYITLTRGYEAVIDVGDVALVEGFNWYALNQKQTVYAYRNIVIDGRRSLESIHRKIMGNPNGLQVDHQDCDGLNNRRSNLRIATHQQNNLNRRITSKNTSGFKGVSWCRDRNKWVAEIMLAGKTTRIGRFDTKLEAYNAYCAYSQKIHGEFGRVK